MSFNYDQDVICGEIDNRVKGIVKGVLLCWLGKVYAF